MFDNRGIIDELKERVRKIALGYDVKIKNQEVDEDYTHILFSSSLKTNMVGFIYSLEKALFFSLIGRG
ncbi:MAG: REP element-mobilizing transposase RayT [Candidatus Methanohalarchaeum thermophilum]|uniref:REP element-mobilizing transposase RayT n=1 Tax=Methanohalarchaeum thermophilum TaxID=1903181 RepID=A0A1Q6DUB1_METT1|nr:MAG: REP element-mobilizing transposase RayT [Candidatus Methanohalarchaeum thermophilum]